MERQTCDQVVQLRETVGSLPNVEDFVGGLFNPFRGHIDETVPADAYEPTLERTRRTERLAISPRAQERLLDGIVGYPTIGSNCPRIRNDRARMIAHKLSETTIADHRRSFRRIKATLPPDTNDVSSQKSWRARELFDANGGLPQRETALTVSRSRTPPSTSEVSGMIRRVALTSVLTGALVLAWAGSASAHVTVDPPSEPQGGTVKLSFLAPNEEAPATVTEVQIFFPVPPATPIATVTVEPKPGWTFHITNLTLAKPLVTDDGSFPTIVSEIDWKANTPADAIGAHEFGEFTIDADSLPSSGTQVVFKAIQTYSNGDIVRWIEPVPAERERCPNTPHRSCNSPTPTPPHPPRTRPPRPCQPPGLAKKSQVDSARTVGIIGIVVGALGLLAAAVALAIRRRPAT